MQSDSEEFIDACESFDDSHSDDPSLHVEEDTEDTSNHEKGKSLTPDEIRKIEEEKLSADELEKRKLDAVAMKDAGNELFQASCFTEALTKYTEALDLCPILCSFERSIMFSNRAACHIKMDAPESAIQDCTASLELQPNYIKCLQRRAGLYEDKERFTDALEDYKRLLELDPHNAKARHACMTLPKRIEIQNEKMKQEMFSQLKQLGNIVLKPFGLSTDNFQVQKNPDSEGYSINFVR